MERIDNPVLKTKTSMYFYSYSLEGIAHLENMVITTFYLQGNTCAIRHQLFSAKRICGGSVGTAEKGVGAVKTGWYQRSLSPSNFY